MICISVQVRCEVLVDHVLPTVSNRVHNLDNIIAMVTLLRHLCHRQLLTQFSTKRLQTISAVL